MSMFHITLCLTCSVLAPVTGASVHLRAHATGTETVQTTARKPNILFVLLDDLGFGDAGFNSMRKGQMTKTPNMDKSAANGIVLSRHYLHSTCSPSRSAIQTGRAPIHVNIFNGFPTWHNPKDPVSGFNGIPRNMTGMAEVLAGAGYATHIVGKWAVGMATPQHTPAGRGYSSSLVYFHHDIDCWTFKIKFRDGPGCPGTFRSNHSEHYRADAWDLWSHDESTPFPGKPAQELLNAHNCKSWSQKGHGKCQYLDELFEDRVKRIIRTHDNSRPLFLFWATRTAHSEYQPPVAAVKEIKDRGIKKYVARDAMIYWIDQAFGRVVQALKDKRLYDNTLIVLCSDNGAEGNLNGLRGGKRTNWEGGIRVAAMVSGGFLPRSVRGTIQKHLITGWDWYATFAGLAGVDATDVKAAKAGLPPHDSIDQWPLLSGASTTALRTRVELGGIRENTGSTVAGGLITFPYKILHDYVGDPHFGNYASCGRTPETGCLYNVFEDPHEKRNLAQEQPEVFKSLLKEVDLVQKGVFVPDRGAREAGDSPEAVCSAISKKYRGFYGPFVD